MSHLKQALELVKKKAPEAHPAIKAAIEERVGVLGEDEVFYTKRGGLQLVKRAVNLSVENGGLVRPGFSDKMPYIVSAQGYEILASKANAVSFFPSTVVSGGKSVPNPCVDKNSKGKTLSVTARAVSMKYSDTGAPIVCDWTTIFDLEAYKMIDLLAKAKKFRQNFMLMPPDQRPTDNQNERWTFYPYDDAVNLWVNVAHPEGIEWYQTIVNREKKAVDFALTFARRNCFKHLFGLQKAPDKSGKWSVPLILTPQVPNFNEPAYLEYQETFEGAVGGSKLIEGAEAAHEDETINAEIEAEEETDENGQTVVVPSKTTTTETYAQAKSNGEEPAEDLVRKEFEMTIDQFEPEANEALRRLGMTNFPDDPEGMAAVKRMINTIVDEEADQ